MKGNSMIRLTILLTIQLRAILELYSTHSHITKIFMSFNF